MTPADRRRREARGRRAETQGLWWLRLHGYRILARRQRTPHGEIDIVARRGRVIAFVEVKTRADLAQAVEAVTPRQRRRIARAAAAYLAAHPDLARATVRFDVIAVAPRRLPRHLTDAWQAEGSWLG